MQEFLRLLTTEGRAAYKVWRGEDGPKPSQTLSGEDFHSACDAAISSISPGYYDWLSVDNRSVSQSLFHGAALLLAPCLHTSRLLRKGHITKACIAAIYHTACTAARYSAHSRAEATLGLAEAPACDVCVLRRRRQGRGEPL